MLLEPPPEVGWGAKRAGVWRRASPGAEALGVGLVLGGSRGARVAGVKKGRRGPRRSPWGPGGYSVMETMEAWESGSGITGFTASWKPLAPRCGVSGFPVPTEHLPPPISLLGIECFRVRSHPRACKSRAVSLTIPSPGPHTRSICSKCGQKSEQTVHSHPARGVAGRRGRGGLQERTPAGTTNRHQPSSLKADRPI